MTETGKQGGGLRSARNEWEDGVIVPIQIRPDHWVRIGRIPHDLTSEEAERIVGVVRAYASPLPAHPSPESPND